MTVGLDSQTSHSQGSLPTSVPPRWSTLKRTATTGQTYTLWSFCHIEKVNGRDSHLMLKTNEVIATMLKSAACSHTCKSTRFSHDNDSNNSSSNSSSSSNISSSNSNNNNNDDNHDKWWYFYYYRYQSVQFEIFYSLITALRTVSNTGLCAKGAVVSLSHTTHWASITCSV